MKSVVYSALILMSCVVGLCAGGGIRNPGHHNVVWDKAVNDPAAASLARPTATQYTWHEQERLMFVCLDPCSWQGREYDNHTSKLSDMKLEKLDVEQWMAAAKSWGAKEVMLVCKHTGGFCWWPTDTTDYCVKNIPWKNGKGNLVQEMAVACRKHGLSVGVYIYSDDPKYASGIGRGGRTDNPAKQEEWNAKLRQQWKEVLGIYGKDMVREIWFDGSCVVPLWDILDAMAPHAVIMQSKRANMRWNGNEEGVANDPNWNTVDKKVLETGAAFQNHSTPDGDAWAPIECDTPLYRHFWFWSARNENRRKTLDHLLQRFVESVGRGSVFLLNSTPNTDGLIPEGDVKLYQSLGKAIEDNFGHPLGKIEQIAGNEVIIKLDGTKAINCLDLWEDYRFGHRIRAYKVDAWVNGHWKPIASGTAVGRRKMDMFHEVATDKIRVRVIKQVGTPLFRQIMVHKVSQRLADTFIQFPSMVGDASVKASSIYSDAYAAQYAIDNHHQTRLNAAPGDKLAWLEVDFHAPRRFAGMTASEAADRIGGYVVEVRNAPDAPWRVVFTGGKIGGNCRVELPATTARFVRFRITDGADLPTLWEMNFFDRADAWEEVTVKPPIDRTPCDIDLSTQVTAAGQYEIRIEGVDISDIHPLYENKLGEDRNLEKTAPNTYRLTRTHAVDVESSTGFRLTAKPSGISAFKVLIRPK